jgi:cobyrinic acid a,c-diamide synthase
MALVVAGERSGVGKTTVTLSLLAALRRRNESVQSFKVGPDYIDPMFHQYVTGRPCRNLDPILTSEAYVQECFARHSQNTTYAIAEGVMGLFDGASGADDIASTAHIARLLDLPVLLVLDCGRLSRSVAAIAHGYKTFDPRIRLAGLVLNRVGSDRHLEFLKSALEPLQIPVLGVLHRQDDITIPDRHLGLVPTAELPALSGLLDRLAILGDRAFDWPQLLPLLKTASQPNQNLEFRIQNSNACTDVLNRLSAQHPTPKIAVASDRAFSFYYMDNLDLLKSLGAELIPWSPLTDAKLPELVQGLYLGGGFPEVFAAELADNVAAQQTVKTAIRQGLPTYAECGGLMYLCEQLVDFSGRSWPMVGILPTVAEMSGRLTLGYRRAIACQDTPLISKGVTVWGHEFHRSKLRHISSAPLYRIRGYDPQSSVQGEGWMWQQVHASYVHLHWGDRPDIPARFLQHCVGEGKRQMADGRRGR